MPSKADILYTSLRVHRTGSRGGAEIGSAAEAGVPRDRQTRPRVNVSENCYKFAIPHEPSG